MAKICYYTIVNEKIKMSETTTQIADQLPSPTGTSEYIALFNQAEFKQWFGDWSAGECDPYSIDAETGLPKIFYHGTCRSFEEFADPSTTVSNQGVDHIDNSATFFFENRAPAESYALNQERELVATIAHLARVFNLKSWEQGIGKWNELMQSVFGEDGDRDRIKISDGIVRFDDEIIGLDTEYAGFFGEEEVKDLEGAGVKTLTPHIAESSRLCDMAEVLVPNWYDPRVIAAVVAFGATDSEEARVAHTQGTNQDLAHSKGLRRSNVDNVVIGSELGLQLSVKDPNRILILESKESPVAH